MVILVTQRTRIAKMQMRYWVLRSAGDDHGHGDDDGEDGHSGDGATKGVMTMTMLFLTVAVLGEATVTLMTMTSS